MDDVREVGRVVSLWRYPVKSMAAEALPYVDVTWQGFAGDRRWAFVRSGQRNGFPWLTPRQRPELVTYRPYLVDREDPDRSAVVVTSPAGVKFDVLDPALASEIAVEPETAWVQKLDRGTFDSAPLSLITTQTVDRLTALVGTAMDPLRFRPNLLIESLSGTPFSEDTWVGRTLRVGDGGMALRIDRRDKRCMVINLDPATGERNPAVLRAVAEHRDVQLGVYGTVVTPGEVAVGDTVLI
jgi:uncharacterized protein